jgi:hypothetical protein
MIVPYNKSLTWLSLLLVVIGLPTTTSFSPRRGRGNRRAFLAVSAAGDRPTSLHQTRLFLSNVRVTTPSQAQAEEMGLREWPQQAKSKGTWEESVKEGQTVVRYVLDGQASVKVNCGTEESTEQVTMKAGSLLEVTGQATLLWQVVSDEIILLTPNFEQVGVFAGVVAAMVVLLGALIATSS